MAIACRESFQLPQIPSKRRSRAHSQHILHIAELLVSVVNEDLEKMMHRYTLREQHPKEEKQRRPVVVARFDTSNREDREDS